MEESFLKKMAEAKKIEREALMGVLPENMSKHLTVISDELSEMMKELAVEVVQRSFAGKEEKSEEKPSGIQKVTIE